MNNEFLETAAVQLCAQDGSRRRSRVFIDAGSHRSFVLRVVAEQLNLKVLGEEDTCMSPFGVEEPVCKKYKRVEVKIASILSNAHIVMECLVADSFAPPTESF